MIEVTNFLFDKSEDSSKRFMDAKQDLDDEVHKAMEADAERNNAARELTQASRRIEILEDQTHSLQREMQQGRDHLATSKNE